MANSAAPSAPKYWVKSVAKAADVLEALAAASYSPHAASSPSPGLSVTEVGAACGISKSAAFGTLQTLCHYGLVADEGTGLNRRYRLGMGLARLGDRARSQVSLRGVAQSALRRLATDTHMATRLAVPQDGYAVVVDQIDVDDRVRIDLRMGHRELPHCTGLGKAILSGLPEAEAAEVIARVGLPRRTARTITDSATLLNHLRSVRRAGYALDDEEDAEGILCIGSPVSDHRGECVGAISVTGLKTGLPAWRYQELGGQVREAAMAISRELGWVPAPDADADAGSDSDAG